MESSNTESLEQHGPSKGLRRAFSVDRNTGLKPMTKNLFNLISSRFETNLRQTLHRDCLPNASERDLRLFIEGFVLSERMSAEKFNLALEQVDSFMSQIVDTPADRAVPVRSTFMAIESQSSDSTLPERPRNAPVQQVPASLSDNTFDRHREERTSRPNSGSSSRNSSASTSDSGRKHSTPLGKDRQKVKIESPMLEYESACCHDCDYGHSIVFAKRKFSSRVKYPRVGSVGAGLGSGPFRPRRCTHLDPRSNKHLFTIEAVNKHRLTIKGLTLFVTFREQPDEIFAVEHFDFWKYKNAISGALNYFHNLRLPPADSLSRFMLALKELGTHRRCLDKHADYLRTQDAHTSRR